MLGRTPQRLDHPRKMEHLRRARVGLPYVRGTGMSTRGNRRNPKMERDTMRKNKLLVAAAVAALTAGSSIALAQAPSGEHQNPASKNAPAEKMAPAAKSNSEQKGAQQGGQPNSRMGQENKSP